MDLEFLRLEAFALEHAQDHNVRSDIVQRGQERSVKGKNIPQSSRKVSNRRLKANDATILPTKYFYK